METLTLDEIVKIILILLISGVVAAFSHGVTDHQGARQVLEKTGYTDINTGESQWFACGGQDLFNTSFSAKMNGREVTGVVCSGAFFKKATVRFDV